MGTQEHLCSFDYPWNSSGPNQPCETQEDTGVCLAALRAHTEDASGKTTSSLKLSRDLASSPPFFAMSRPISPKLPGTGKRPDLLALLWGSRIVPSKIAR